MVIGKVLQLTAPCQEDGLAHDQPRGRGGQEGQCPQYFEPKPMRFIPSRKTGVTNDAIESFDSFTTTAAPRHS
jgi:hypothetical protein